MACMQNQLNKLIRKPRRMQQGREGDTQIIVNKTEDVVCGFNITPNDSSVAISAVEGSMETPSTPGSLAWQTTMR